METNNVRSAVGTAMSGGEIWQEQLIELVKVRPASFDKTHRDYPDTHVIKTTTGKM